MTKPPPSGPHSDIDGVNRDARIGAPNTNEANGSAEDRQSADEGSAATPERQPSVGE